MDKNEKILCFYSGKLLNEDSELTFEQISTLEDKKKNQMKILVYKLEDLKEKSKEKPEEKSKEKKVMKRVSKSL